MLCSACMPLLGACSNAPCYSAAERTHSIYVVKRAWHTGIAVPLTDWPDRNWELLADFPEAKYLEFGWGDAAYYQAQEKTLWMTLAAALWPTPSVMEVVGLTELSTAGNAEYEAVEVPVSAAALNAVAQSIEKSFAGSNVTPTGVAFEISGGTVRFYHARGSFYFPNMCNRWTARQLETAGCPIRTATVVMASRVMREAGRFK